MALRLIQDHAGRDVAIENTQITQIVQHGGPGGDEPPTAGQQPGGGPPEGAGPPVRVRVHLTDGNFVIVDGTVQTVAFQLGLTLEAPPVIDHRQPASL